MRLSRVFTRREIIENRRRTASATTDPNPVVWASLYANADPCARHAAAVGMKYDFAMENCLGTDYPNLHELNKNCYGFSPASVQNGPQAAAAAAAADEQTMYKVTIITTNKIILLVKKHCRIDNPCSSLT